MINTLDIVDFLTLDKSIPIFDVRTTSEFEQGHIPLAINLPIFSMEERAIIGTTYKQVGREEAILKGFEIVGPKWAEFIKKVQSITHSKKIAIHCWRGGMRSGAMAWALSFFGFEVVILKGGYKAFRNHVIANFNCQLNLKIIGGLTGSGKTILLQSLQLKGEQILDLENLAQHQGSAFGSLGYLIQPSQEQFENNLFESLAKLDPSKTIWLEDESITIGKRVIPVGIWEQMKTSTVFNIELPFQERVKLLLATYGILSKDFLIAATLKISKRLGPKLTTETIQEIENNNMENFIKNVLFYYDKTYQMGLSKREPKKLISISNKLFNTEELVERILQETEKLNHDGRN